MEAEPEEFEWECACGETDITKHDLGMAIAHAYEIPEEEGREIHFRVRERILGHR